jgi:transposase
MAAGRKSPIGDWLTDDGLILLEGWAREGLKDEDIADKIGISKSTFYKWKSESKEFSDALKRGKAPVDFKVENQTLKSALGYFIEIEEPIKLKTKKQLIDKGTIEEEHIEYVKKQVYIPPVPACQFFWLKNRKPGKWRDRQETISAGIDEATRNEVNDLVSRLREQSADEKSGS